MDKDIAYTALARRRAVIHYTVHYNTRLLGSKSHTCTLRTYLCINVLWHRPSILRRQSSCHSRRLCIQYCLGLGTPCRHRLNVHRTCRRQNSRAVVCVCVLCNWMTLQRSLQNTCYQPDYNRITLSRLTVIIELDNSLASGYLQGGPENSAHFQFTTSMQPLKIYRNTCNRNVVRFFENNYYIGCTSYVLAKDSFWRFQVR